MSAHNVAASAMCLSANRPLNYAQYAHLTALLALTLIQTERKLKRQPGLEGHVTLLDLAAVKFGKRHHFDFFSPF